ncbi:MAG TPA: TMEM175 family protein [Thermoanaerobaculia bacterium]|nr:TMEM175 family protein [Thermoanaerobaculia bacterium]
MIRRDADRREETSRVEAFSDGVFAIAMTLLILEIRTPEHVEPGALPAALFALWPSYLAFLTSFFTIGVMWMNHHRLFNLIGQSDQGLLIANLLLLLCVTFIPFPTAVLARFLGHSDANVAAVLYNAVFLCSALAFQLLWRHASGEKRLLEKDSDPESVRAITRQYRFGPLLYLALIVIAFLTPTTSLLLNLAIAVFFALPSGWFRRRRSA